MRSGCQILTDLYAFIATGIVGGVILLTGFLRADPLASVLIAALMFRAAYGLIREAGECAPCARRRRYDAGFT